MQVERAGIRISTMMGSRREIQKASFHYLLLLIIQSKKRTQQRFLTFHLTSPRLKAKSYAKRQKRKIRTRDKKKKKSNTSNSILA